MRLPDCFGKCGLARIAKKESSAPLVLFFFGAGKPHFSFAKLWYFFFGWLESWSLFAAPQVASANTFPTVCAQNLQDQGCLLHGVHECLSLHWCWWPGELLCLFLSLHWCSLAGESLQGRPPPRLQKVCRFQVPKMNPLDMARCCSESNRKISKCGNTSPVHCQILKRANVQLFQRRKRNLYSFLFTLPKVTRLHSGFFLSIFW